MMSGQPGDQAAHEADVPSVVVWLNYGKFFDERPRGKPDVLRSSAGLLESPANIVQGFFRDLLFGVDYLSRGFFVPQSLYLLAYRAVSRFADMPLHTRFPVVAFAHLGHSVLANSGSCFALLRAVSACFVAARISF